MGSLYRSVRREVRRKWRPARVLLLGTVLVLMMGYMGLSSLHAGSFIDTGSNDNNFGRKLLEATTESPLSTNESNASCAGPLYPPNPFVGNAMWGGIWLYILGILYMFLALAIVCDEFFVPSLEVIIDKFGVSEDVAGATFMAAGGSAPELFTSLIGTFIAVSDVGIGTIVGSAVFNILFVIALCALCSKDVLQLTWWPLARDVSFYSVSLICLLGFFYDGWIDWYESLILLGCYAAYAIFMKFNGFFSEKFQKKKDEQKTAVDEPLKPTTDAEPQEPQKPAIKIGWANARKHQNMIMASNELANRVNIKNPGMFRAGFAQLMMQKGYEFSLGDVVYDVTTDNITPTTENVDAEDSSALNMSWPVKTRKKISYVLLAPLLFPLWLTLPDVRKEKAKKFFPWSFLGSILWIAVFSYLMNWWASEVGCFVGIPPAVMGLTFLAAGTSIPDLITSVIVAKKGFGDMAVSSSIGSNIFDVTVGLPMPWLIYSMIYGSYKVTSNGLFCSIGLLFIMLIIIIAMIAAFKWKMTKKMGIAMLGSYAVFLTLALLLEYKIITCPI